MQKLKLKLKQELPHLRYLSRLTELLQKNLSIITPELCPAICLCTQDPAAESEGSTGGLPSTTGSASSTGSGSIGPLCDSATGKLPESDEISKFKQFSKLREEKYEIVEDIRENKATLKIIESAETLDGKLPEIAKDKNRYLVGIKEEFSSYFDEESGNSSIKESLTEIKEYINSEQMALKSKLDNIESKFKDLNVDSTEDNPESSKNPPKRDGSESDADKQSDKKRSRTDGGNDNNGSGPSSSSGPSQGGSDPSPPSTPNQAGGLSDTSSDPGQVQLLDIIITIINVLLGDDNLDQQNSRFTYYCYFSLSVLLIPLYIRSGGIII